jgi:hypothetical protein
MSKRTPVYITSAFVHEGHSSQCMGIFISLEGARPDEPVFTIPIRGPLTKERKDRLSRLGCDLLMAAIDLETKVEHEEHVQVHAGDTRH